MIALFKNYCVVIQKQNPATFVTAEILTDWDVTPLHHYRRQNNFSCTNLIIVLCFIVLQFHKTKYIRLYIFNLIMVFGLGLHDLFRVKVIKKYIFGFCFIFNVCCSFNVKQKNKA